MKTFSYYCILSFVVSLAFLSCQEDEQNNVTPGTDSLVVANLDLKGYVQKGPFINGTSITVSELSQTLTATGKNFNTQIIDNKGAFSLKGVSLKSAYVQLKADGFYFDEVKGEKSAAQLTLYALADVSDISSVNVNLLSHLEKDRVTYLIQEKEQSFAAAKQQAQQEILAIFGIIKADIAHSEMLDISQDGEDNAILLAISAILQGNNTVAELSELLANIITDIREDGKLDSESSRTKIRSQAMQLKLATIRQHLVTRYGELGVNATIANFEKYIDSDGDGILNKDEDDMPDEFAFDTQKDVAVSTEITSNEVTITGLKAGGTSDVTVESGTLLINGTVVAGTTAQVKNGDKLKLMVTSSSQYADTVTASLRVAGGILTKFFTVVTDDYKPDDFNFAPVENAKRDSIYFSQTIVISGLPHVTPISLDNGSLLVNGIEIDNLPAVISNGDQITIKLTSIQEYEKTTLSNIQIGSVTKVFKITTELYYWQPKTGYPGRAYSYMIGFSIGNKVYVGTGCSDAGYEKEFYEYDPQTNQWTKKADFGGEGRCMAVGFAIDNKGYIGMGASTDFLTDFWEYDPATDTWKQVASFPGNGRRGEQAFTIDNIAYLGLGTDGNNNYLNDFWKFNPLTNQWTQTANFQGDGREWAFNFVISSKAYVGGGYNYYTIGYLPDFWEYNPLTDQWIQKQSFYNTDKSGAAFTVGEYGYNSFGNNALDFYKFAPSNEEWTALTIPSFGEVLYSISTGKNGYVIASNGKFYEFIPPQQ